MNTNNKFILPDGGGSTGALSPKFVKIPNVNVVGPWTRISCIMLVGAGFVSNKMRVFALSWAGAILAGIVFAIVGGQATQWLITIVSCTPSVMTLVAWLCQEVMVMDITAPRVVTVLLFLMGTWLLRPVRVIDEDPLTVELTQLLNSDDPVVHRTLEEWQELQSKETLVETERRYGRSHQHAVVTFALHAKAKFGLQERSEANRVVVRRFIYSEMVSHGMRPTHIAKIIDLATLLTFVPTDTDVRVAQMSMCKDWCDRDSFVKRPSASGPAGPGLKFVSD